MSILGPFRVFFFFLKQYIQRWAAETNMPSAALEIFFLNFCGMFYLGGFLRSLILLP